MWLKIAGFGVECRSRGVLEGGRVTIILVSAKKKGLLFSLARVAFVAASAPLVDSTLGSFVV